MKTLDIVVPFFNESEGIEVFLKSLEKNFEKSSYFVNYIFIDDGSTDNTWKELIKFGNNRACTLLKFSRNFGHQEAIYAGLVHAKGDLCAILDGDGQDPPEILLKMVAVLEQENCDVVYGVRETREESWYKNLAYKYFYRVLDVFSSYRIPLDAGDFSVLSSRVVKHLVKNYEHNLFIRGTRAYIGLKQIPFYYDRPKREHGEAKYDFFKLLTLALNGLISSGHAPLKLASIVGLCVSLLSFAYGILTIFQKIFTNTTVPGYTTTIILLTFLGGVQLLFLGLIGEYMARIYDNSRNRPLFVIEEKITREEKSLSRAS